MINPYEGLSVGVTLLLVLLMIWESVWKGIALWKAGKNNQLGWFVCIFIFNTAGLLPIIYLAFFRSNKIKPKAKPAKKAPKKKAKKK